jgi:nucleoside-diphosphate-sugar epimerase
VLIHQFKTPQKPSRVVVLGSGGFIGGAIYQRLNRSGIPTLALARDQLDLLDPQAAGKLAEKLDENDTLVFVSAKAPCKDMAMLIENTLIAQSVCKAIKLKPVSHVIYISSDAVYKDSNTALTETSCAEPSAIHGVMHLVREVALRQEYPGPLAIVRPTLVYGFDDPHNGYGPNRFRRLAAAGKDIQLFGEGEEHRDHVDVNDIAELIFLISMHRSSGIANAVSGEVVSFRDLAEHAVAAFKGDVKVKGSPRSGPMPHNGYRSFDNAAVIDAFPGFRFKGWNEGLSAVYQRQREELST